MTEIEHITKKLAVYISPSPEFTPLVREVMAELNLLERFDIFESDTLGLLERIQAHDYKLVIADGLSAINLRELPEITVLELLPDITSFLCDIRSLKQAGAQHIAVLSTPTYIQTYDQLQLDGLKIFFHPIYTTEEIPVAVGSLRLDQVDAVLTDYTSKQYIENHYPQLLCRVFSLSRLTLHNMLKAAERILHLEKVKRLQLTRLDLLIDSIQEGVLIFNKKQETVFHNALADRILKDYDPEQWYSTIEPFFETTNGAYNVVSLGKKQILMHSMHFIFPGTDIDNHVVVMQEADSIEHNEQTLRRHNASINKGLIAKATFASMLIKDPNMEDVVAKAKLFAKTDSTVLITGETGVGKELLAQSIHNQSPRRAEPFVSLNCASLPSSLIESELFGYAEGAFTGARKQGKKGMFELANQGTIFLDEIGELTLEVQTRLLRVLQEREVMRIGDERIIPLNVRVICATHRDLLQMTKHGTFRLDLYYRINVLHLRIPPLRQRYYDILPLFTRFIKSHLGRASSARLQIDDDAREYLLKHPWWGNIRELSNVAEAVSLYGPHVTLSQLINVMETNIPQEEHPLAEGLVYSGTGQGLEHFNSKIFNADSGFSSKSGHLNLHIAKSNQEAATTNAKAQPHDASGSAAAPDTKEASAHDEASALPDSAASVASETTPNDSGERVLQLHLPQNFTLKDIERCALYSLLQSTSQQELCSQLGISRVTLWRKLKGSLASTEGDTVSSN